MARRTRWLNHEQLILTTCLVGGLPAVVFALAWAWGQPREPEVRGTVTLLVLGCWLGFALAARQRVARPLQTMANLLLALKEGDFSFRARGAAQKDALGELLAEINGLGDILQRNRRGAMEATVLLSAVIQEIDIAIFAFDSEGVLRLVNPAGEGLLGEPAERLLGRTAARVGLGECLEGDSNRILGPATLPRARGRWGMRRTAFREEGRPHQLVVIGDLSQPLREERLRAWQHLVRVLGHELNNSLAPIKSIATTLGSSLEGKPRDAEWEGDLRSGLGIIASRAEGLERFLRGYARLARLPPPTLAPCDLGGLLARAAALERRMAVEVVQGPELELPIDRDQVENAVINLVRNAVDAACASKPPLVRVLWRVSGSMAEVSVEDNGPGLPETANLFVPFFTTKPEGSGIGLVLTQQIAENHGGSLSLANRGDCPGCVAVMRLPLDAGPGRPDGRPDTGTAVSRPR